MTTRDRLAADRLLDLEGVSSREISREHVERLHQTVTASVADVALAILAHGANLTAAANEVRSPYTYTYTYTYTISIYPRRQPDGRRQ